MDVGGLAPGTEVGGYRIVEPLGSGGMGTVYRAVDGGGSAVALKVLHPHVGADPAARDRLRREVAALQRLRHPGVAAVLDAEADSTEAFVVTELVDGLTLEEHVRRDGPLPAVEVAVLAAGLCDALEAVHAAGVVHRDLKPGNVMLTARGPVLIDFGIAQAAEDTRVTSAGFVVGTPGYLAPELLADGDPSRVTDWWGWAAVLAFAAAGRPPFGSRPLDAVIARTRAGDVDLAGVPPEVAAPLRQALHPHPTRRRAPDDVVADLARVAAGVLPPPATQVLGTGTDVPGADPRHDLGSAPTRVVGAVPTRLMPEPGAGAVAGAAAPASDGSTRALPVSEAGATAVLPAAGRRPPVVVPAGTYDRTPADPAYPVGAGGPVGPVGPGGSVGMAAGDDGGQGWSASHGDDGRGPDDGPGSPDGDADGEPYVPPRPRRRTGSVLALGIAAVAGGMLYPGVTLLVVAAGLLLFRTVGSAAQARDDRRERRGGPVRGDTARAVAATPWHLLRALVGLLPSVIIAASVVVVVGGVLWWALQTGRLVVTLGASPSDGVNGPLAFSAALGVAVLLGVVTAWLGPLTSLTRAGARRVLGAVAPGWSGAAVLVTLALGAAGVLVVLLGTGQAVTWWPIPGPPSLR